MASQRLELNGIRWYWEDGSSRAILDFASQIILVEEFFDPTFDENGSLKDEDD
jgi:hypothetical protein